MRAVAAFLAGVLCWLAAAAPAAPGTVASTLAASSFVQADGPGLTRNGQPFRLKGAAIYGTSNPHLPGDDHTTQVLDWAEDAHLNTLRLVNMFVEDGLDDGAPTDPTNWAHVDQLLADIGDRGMVAVLDLSAFRNHLLKRDLRLTGHIADCQPNTPRPPGTYAAVSPYRVSLATEWNDFIDFVTSRVNTVTGVVYKDDPTIAVISVAGEPEPPNTEECGKATTTAELTDFYERTLGRLAADDPNHLHSTGGLFKTDWQHQCQGCGGSGIDGQAIFALADNTLPAVHTYPPDWSYEPNGTPIDYQAQDLGSYAQTLGKPWFTEEAGWPQSIGDAKRASYITWLNAVQEAYGSAGALHWNLGPQVAGGSHDINPGTPLAWNAVRGPLGTWTPAGSLPSPRSAMPAVTVPDGRVLVLGGGNLSVQTSDVRAFNPATNAWSGVAPMSIPRSYETATVLDDGSVFVAGGYSGPGTTSFTAIYQPVFNTWAPTHALLTRQARHTATKLTDGRVLLVGGSGAPENSLQTLGQASAEIYDPASDSFTFAADMGSYRYEHFAARLPDGEVLVAGGLGSPVVGGSGPNSSQNLRSAEIFDPVANTWTPLPDMLDSHHYGIATTLLDGRVLVAGGEAGNVSGTGTADAEIFDPATNTWSQVASMRSIRTHHVAARLADGRVLVSGGYQPNGLQGNVNFASGEIYDPVTDAWTAAASTSVPRWDGAVAALQDGTVLVVGGSSSLAPFQLASAERFDPIPVVASRPDMPRNVAAVPGNGQAVVSWFPAESDGGGALTGYLVTTFPGEATTTVGGASSLATITGLTNGSQYTFMVQATNAAGSGAPSPFTAPVVPTAPPPTDQIAPTIDLARPDRDLYSLDEPVTVSFFCDDTGGSGLATCIGSLADGSSLPTSVAGHFTFSVTATDHAGNETSVSHDYDVTAGDVTTTVQPGPATVTTDPGGIGATPAVPIQTSVQFTAPAGPATPVSIDLHAPNIPAPSGYAILGNEVDIDLGGVTRPFDDPIVITFLVDSSTGADPATITVSRTNADATTDIALPCDALPFASPDPCYTSAFVGGAGTDVLVTIRTTHASKWLALRRTDTTPPVVKSTVTGSQGLSGWYRGNVAVSWTKTDAQSAILVSTGCAPTTISSDTGGTTLTCSATSAGGTTTQSVTVKRDATPPTLTCFGGPFLLNEKNAKVGVTVTDGLSGPLVPSVTIVGVDTSTAGRRSVPLVGLDKAGNIATTSCSYLVTYSLANLKPAAGSSVKRGTTIAVEFKLKDAAGKVISDSAAKAIANACAATIQFSAGNPSPNCIRYDAGSDTFQFDLKTSKTMPPGNYTIGVKVVSGADVLASGSVVVAIKT